MEVVGNITEFLFSVEVVSAFAHFYASLPLYPFFSTVHFILTALALRSEEGKCRHPRWVLGRGLSRDQR